MQTKRNTKIYLAVVNLMGLYSDEPIVCHRNSQGKWVAENGRFLFDSIGIHRDAHYLYFSSANKYNVEIWIKAVKSYGVFLGLS